MPFLVRTCTSDLPPPPSQWGSTPPPVYARDPSLCVGIIKKANVVGMPPDAGGNDNVLPGGSPVVAGSMGFMDAVDG